MLPRLDQAARMLHHNEQHPYAFQHVLGSQLQEKAERERTQVKQKAEVEHGTVQKEKQGSGKEQGAQARGGRRQRPHEPPERARGTDRGGRLDVKV